MALAVSVLPRPAGPKMYAPRPGEAAMPDSTRLASASHSVGGTDVTPQSLRRLHAR